LYQQLEEGLVVREDKYIPDIYLGGGGGMGQQFPSLLITNLDSVPADFFSYYYVITADPIPEVGYKISKIQLFFNATIDAFTGYM
jgi:hypothetical protein